MVRYLSPLLLFVLLAMAAACDSSDPTLNGPDPIDIPTRLVVYEVFGTYRTCDITYTDADGSDFELVDEPLDWIDSVKVAVNQTFLARVSATCADIERDGKATIRLTVDGLVVGSDDVLGFGSSGSVQRQLQPIG